ncbi:hypothetical protein E2P86_09450 [Sphingobacterium psychroaquaticum]|uniref:hypothetical protein n=1 Tax=Sphingobacterium psychroaquaticum TaxID=561061 RepID=UPI00106D9F91|nr:hypothetical protein [Sphingobacterium psychroaquaticum]QBQ41369.1 hypothetical protein E2P86_09450 [Sphingobacterium psychroaquaticum]
MKNLILFLALFGLVAQSCTKEKTDYEAEKDNDIIENETFKEATVINNGAYTIHIESLHGMFYKGYNEIRLTVKKGTVVQPVSSFTFLPIRTEASTKTSSCPHQYDMTYQAQGNYFIGYSVFTEETDATGSWDLYLSFTVDGQLHTSKKRITVEKQSNRNRSMTTFIGKDEVQYYIALIAPQRPKVGENPLVAGIYKYSPSVSPTSGEFPDPAQYNYNPVADYALRLDPRMPEPSMGNHSSPNNKDLVQGKDGLYYGVVNYTMTGNWTLNFILQNQHGKILKGTEVPTDFTPGVAGKKSDLYLDVLF